MSTKESRENRAMHGITVALLSEDPERLETTRPLAGESSRTGSLQRLWGTCVIPEGTYGFGGHDSSYDGSAHSIFIVAIKSGCLP